jgi:FHS family L-fucose permease-like MFS transporter
VIASGLAFLETGASPFIAQIGTPETAERRLNFSQAFNPLGSISGVLVGTTFIFSGIELNPARIAALKSSGRYATVLHAETMRVIAPYVVLAVIVLLWAVLLAKTKFPKLGEETTGATADHGHYRELLQYPHFILAVLAQFFYVGAQVGTWSYFIQYVQDYTGESEKVAGYFLTGTLAAFALGRFAATYLMKFIRPNVLMGIYSIVNVTLVGIGVLLPGWIGLWAIFVTSFFMSLMFPTIFGLGLRGIGPNTKLGGSLLVMAIIGGAVFTPVMGLVAESTASMAKAMIVPLFCYVFIGYFSFFGSRPKNAP